MHDSELETYNLALIGPTQILSEAETKQIIDKL